MKLGMYTRQITEKSTNAATRYSAMPDMPRPYVPGPGILERVTPAVAEAGMRVYKYLYAKNQERASNEATESVLDAHKDFTDALYDRIRSGETEDIQDYLRGVEEDLIAQYTEDMGEYASTRFRIQFKEHVNKTYRDTVLNQAKEEEQRAAINYQAAVQEHIQQGNKFAVYEESMQQIALGNLDVSSLGIINPEVEERIIHLINQGRENNGDYRDAAVAYLKAAEFEDEQLVDEGTSLYSNIQYQLRRSEARRDYLETEDPQQAYEMLVKNPQLLDTYGLSDKDKQAIYQEAENRYKDQINLENKNRSDNERYLFSQAADMYKDYSLTYQTLTDFLVNGMTKEDYNFYKGLLDWRIKLSEEGTEEEEEQKYEDLQALANELNTEYNTKLATSSPEDAAAMIKKISAHAELFYDHSPSHNAFNANGLISKYKTKLDDSLSVDYLNSARKDALKGKFRLTPSEWADFEDRISEYNMRNVYDPKTWEIREGAPSSEERVTAYQNILNNFLAERFGAKYLEMFEEGDNVLRAGSYIPDEFTLPEIRDLINGISKKGKIPQKRMGIFESTRDEEKIVRFVNRGGFYGIAGVYAGDIQKYANIAKTEVEEILGKEGAQIKYYKDSIPVFVFGEGKEAYVLDTQQTPKGYLELIAKPFTRFAAENAIVRADPVSDLHDKIAATYSERNKSEDGWTGIVTNVHMGQDSRGREVIASGQVLVRGEPKDLMKLWDEGRVKKWGSIDEQFTHIPGVAGNLRVYMDGKRIENPSSVLGENSWVLRMDNGYHVLQFPQR